MAHNWKRQASLAYGCALTRLALNFYLFFEELPEQYEDENSSQRELDGQLVGLTGSFLDGKAKELLEQISAFRIRIQDEMHQVMAYSDALQVYEYVLNRLEPRFEGELFPEEDDEAAREILRYIFWIRITCLSMSGYSRCSHSFRCA